MALDAYDPWEYFGTTKTTAIAALRARLGATYATSPVDADLLATLRLAVEYLHRATDRWFVVRTGTLELDGTDAPVLWLPIPVVSVAQGGSGVTSVRLADDTEAIDPTSYVVVDGALPGPDDPRLNPRIERVTASRTSTPPIAYGRASVWPAGAKNVLVTGSFGYVEEDGSTPELIRRALARLVVYSLPAADAVEDAEDRKRGAIVWEAVRGRSYTLGAHAAGGGLTLDRETDAILRSFRRPPDAKISRPPRRGARSRYYL